MENVTLIGLNELGINACLVYEKRPCKIISKVNVKNGKHGCAKSIMDIKDIFNNKKHKLTLSSDEKVESPIITKIEYTVMNIDDDYVEISDSIGEMCDPMKLPEDIELRNKIEKIFDEESQVLIIVMTAMGESQIMNCDKSKEK